MTQAKEVVNIKLILFLCHSETVVNVGTISLECLDDQLISFRVVTSLDGVSCSLIQTFFSGVCDWRRRLTFRLTAVTMVSLYIVVAI